MALVVAVYLAYSSFGVAAPFLWGHHGYHGATYVQRARMTLRFHMLTPANWAGYDYPPRAAWYYHQPIGYHHLLDLPALLIGDGEWLPRGFAALSGLFTIWALFVLVRRWWSREAALLACAVWVALPAVCSFSVLSDPMLPAMALSAVTVDMYLRYLYDAGTRKRLIAGCLGILGGALLTWDAYFQAFCHAVAALGWMVSRRARGRRWDAIKWCAATGLTATAALVAHFSLVVKMGMTDDLRASYHQRHDTRLNWVIEQHKKWLELLYGWPVITIGLLWIAVFLLRLVFKKGRARDQAVWIFFQLNLAYCYFFSGASAVHLYRVFGFSAFFALALTDLVVDARAAVAWLLAKRPELARRAALAVGGVAIAGWFAVETPHALHNLVESREMMGTHGQPGYNADYPKTLFAMELAKRTDASDFIFVHDDMPRRIEFYYYMDRSNLDIHSLAQLPSLTKMHARNLVALSAYPVASERRMLFEMIKHHPATRWDQYLLVDLRSDQPGVREYEFKPQPMTRAWWWFKSHKYPPMKPVPVTTAYGECMDAVAHVAPPPDARIPAPPAPGKTEIALCHHNFLALADAAAAAAYRKALLAPVGPVDARLSDAGRVVALRATRTGAEVWTLYDRALPDGLVARYRLTPVGGGAPVAGEVPPSNAEWPMPRAAGYLTVDAARWAVPAGRYRLTWELAPPSPPAPRPALVQKGRPAVPSVPRVETPAVASAELGEIELR